MFKILFCIFIYVGITIIEKLDKEDRKRYEQTNWNE